MTEQANINYDRIAASIAFIQANFKEQPQLDDVARHIHLSPFHFQRLFSEWVGTTPKKFLQFTTIEYAKSLLKENQSTLFHTALETGLSGTGRLHDLFINIEGMTLAEYKSGGINLAINYSYAASPFGKILIASTQRGICYMVFVDDDQAALSKLQNHFPQAKFSPTTDQHQQNALPIFKNDWTDLHQIKLHLKGTDFQLKVWQSLLKIPKAGLTTYRNIASSIGKPNASRAVGTAIGSNPVAFLIPCHRVIQSSGILGGYMWGNTRKTAIIGWEAATENGQLEQAEE